MLRALKSLYRLFIPAVCPVCGSILEAEEGVACLKCMLQAPYTYLWERQDNPMELRLRCHIPVVRAASMLWFREHSLWRGVIHDFKYHSQWYAAEQMGRLCALKLKDADFFSDVDLIVPVPLHPYRRLVRGYNQSEHIAAGISAAAKVPCCFNAVRRLRNNPPQVGQNYTSRWANIDKIFAVSRPEALVGKHIVIVDDVFTTGATIIALAQAILLSCNGNVRISVVTLSVSERIAES